MKEPPPALPPYSYVPGGPWPHPNHAPDGHAQGHPDTEVPPIDPDGWADSTAYLRGIALFNAGYYWEAHEAWEALWHAHGRRGPIAAVIQALIKLAAAGVKIREGRPVGARTHASRAATLFQAAEAESGPHLLGLNLGEWIIRAREIAQEPPPDPGPSGAPVTRVFPFAINAVSPEGPDPS